MLFIGGFGVSASVLGMPDVGLMTLTEMAEAVRRMTTRIRVPLIADGDTGHGDLQNVQRTIREFESAGAAGIILEDQVSPKRCGHFAGKQVIETEEMVGKLKVALDARRDADFVIVARTDARAVHGIDAAIERANRYGEAGADVCFIEAPENRQEMERIPFDVKYPLLVNMLTGGLTPILDCDALQEMGYKIAVCPIETLLVAGAAIQRLIETFLSEGRVDSLQDEMMTFEQIKQVLGLPEILKLRPPREPRLFEEPGS
jgi:2-methylisocitrate lyase-like PEP mutase family enzyme